MRREIAIILVALELLLSISFLSASAYLFVQARHFSPFAELTKAQTLLRQYADAADAQRDNLDRFGSAVIPGYSANLRDLSALTRDLQPIAKLLRQAAKTSTPSVLGVAGMKPFAELEDAARDLEALLPRLSKSLNETSRSLKSYTSKDHEKLIQALDSTILVLNQTADDIDVWKQSIPRGIRLASAVLLLFSLTVMMLSVSQTLTLPPARS